jgi:peroxiredoxin Q/BCP
MNAAATVAKTVTATASVMSEMRFSFLRKLYRLSCLPGMEAAPRSRIAAMQILALYSEFSADSINILYPRVPLPWPTSISKAHKWTKGWRRVSSFVQEGDIAPEFTLPGDGGSNLRLADQRGRKVVLYFYPKDDTSGCTREAIDFTALLPDFATADTAVIGISPDTVASHDRFKAKHALGIALAADLDRRVLETYGVWKEKSMYGRKYMGVERTTILIGRDGHIVRIWRKVAVPGHAAEVLAAARALD